MAVQLLCVLALASLCTASAPDCSQVVKPLVLEDRSQIYGKWVLHVSTWDKPALKNDLVTVKSSWIELAQTSDSGQMTLAWADRLEDGKCLQGVANVTLTGTTTHSTFIINGHTSYHDGKYYETCPDCMLSSDTTLLPNGQTKGRYLFLFTRTGRLEEPHLETFKKQAECLNFLPEYIFTGTDTCENETTTAV